MTIKCPNCGFTVYNRRFPKCESCGATLGPDLAFTEQERRDLFEKDRLEAEAAWQQKQLAERRRLQQEGGVDGSPI